MGVVTYLSDTLRNLASGLGTSRDKATSAEFYLNELQPEQLEAMYRGDWMADKAVDIPAFDSVRNWRSWQADSKVIEQLEEEERRLDVPGKLLEVMILARLWGGAALVMGVGSDDPREELSPDRVGKGELRYLHVMTRHELCAAELRRDPEDPWFREPVMWTLSTEQGMTVEIHPSRVIPFIGKRRPRRSLALDPWGDSILQKIADTVKNAGLASQAIAQLLSEAKIDVVKVPGLMERHLASQESTQRLTTRFSTAMSIKSATNTLILDSEEEYEQKQVSFSELPEVLQQYLLTVSGAADIPATRMLGQSPSGLNSTGESDLKNYYDRIGAEQRLTLTPRLSRLDEVLIRSGTGRRDKAVHYAWAPLWQTSEKEAAEIEKGRSETFSKIGASGLLPSKVASKVLVNSMIESGRYPGIETAMEEYEAETGEFDPEAGGPDDPDEEETGRDPETGETVRDAAPRTLYVHRKVLNGAAILKWAKAQGFTSTLKAGDLHVTIAFSRKPVDWIKAGAGWAGDEEGRLTIKAGGPRIVEPLGPKGAVVLHFASNELVWRHEDIKRQTGASWDWDDYQPHITITYEGAGIDLSKVEPYTGKIELGPEVFEEVVEDWEKGRG